MKSSNKWLRRKGSSASTLNQRCAKPCTKLASNGHRRFPRDRNSRDFEAGELGFEPRLTESESVVLPLHHSPMLLTAASCQKLVPAREKPVLVELQRAVEPCDYGTPRRLRGQYRRFHAF